MINIENIYYMMAYAFRNIKSSGIASLGEETFDNAADLIAAMLIKSLSAQIRKGITRAYIDVEGNLRSPRGKINISGSLKMNTHLRRELNCEYDEFSSNVLLNQILKSTVNLLKASNYVVIHRRKELRKLLLHFSSVDLIQIKNVNWNELNYHRNNKEYRFMISICYLISSGMILRDKDGKNKLVNFIDDQQMSRLYEKFVLEYYKLHYPMMMVSASYIGWNVDDGITDFLPLMKSDITLEYNNRILIIDTKYYSRTMQTNSYYDSKSLHSNNLYQIFTYVKNKDLKNDGSVNGMLLYAKTDEMITPNQKFEMSGNSIYVKTLPLDQKFDVIKDKLDDIARIFID